MADVKSTETVVSRRNLLLKETRRMFDHSIRVYVGVTSTSPLPLPSPPLSFSVPSSVKLSEVCKSRLSAIQIYSASNIPSLQQSLNLCAKIHVSAFSRHIKTGAARAFTRISRTYISRPSPSRRHTDDYGYINCTRYSELTWAPPFRVFDLPTLLVFLFSFFFFGSLCDTPNAYVNGTRLSVRVSEASSGRLIGHPTSIDHAHFGCSSKSRTRVLRDSCVAYCSRREKEARIQIVHVIPRECCVSKCL